MTVARWPAALVLENGRVFQGQGFGARVESIAEVVFNTSITGYQEIVSDPSYAGQIVVMTAPEIGNVGANDDDLETRRIVCAGLAVREVSPVVSSWRARGGLGDWLESGGLPGIDDIDTRALTRVLRDEGAMRGAITPHVAETDAVLAAHRDRITWDAPIHSVADVEALPFAPRMINVKPSRSGGLRPLFALYDYCEQRGIRMYGGGQFELGAGRGHIQYLASLFHADGPNDVAPGGYNDPEPVAGLPTSPLAPRAHDRGFRWG